MTKKIICVGNIVRDDVFHVAALPAAGIKVDALHYESRFGGPAATAAAAIGALGGRVAYWGRVGDDMAGQAAIAALQAHGVETDGVAIAKDGHTRNAVVMVDARGERAIITNRKGLPDGEHLVPDDALDDVSAVLADSRWLIGSARVVERAKKRGICTIFDADGGDREAAERIIAMADHVVFSQEGLCDLGSGGDAKALLQSLAAPGKILAVTLGADGSLWLIDGVFSHVPAFTVEITDTTGCGDVFHGAYALGIAENRAPLDAARFAAAVAAIKAQRGRGWHGLPNRADVLALMRS